MQQNTQPKQQVDLQQAIQQLLASGLSYLQVWSKIQACKSLFKKGTPEFYACLGINPPTTPQQKPAPQPAPQPKPSPQQAAMAPAASQSNAMKMALMLGVILIAIFILRDSRRRYNEELRREEKE